jgi:hypothetical protein
VSVSVSLSRSVPVFLSLSLSLSLSLTHSFARTAGGDAAQSNSRIGVNGPRYPDTRTKQPKPNTHACTQSHSITHTRDPYSANILS